MVTTLLKLIQKIILMLGMDNLIFNKHMVLEEMWWAGESMREITKIAKPMDMEDLL